MENILKKKLLINDICYQMLFMFTKQQVKFSKPESKILFTENMELVQTIVSEMKQYNDFFSGNELTALNSIYN